MFEQTRIKTVSLSIIILCFAAYILFGDYFSRELVTEVAILAILAISLDMVAGYGGMISLCHGAMFGLAAYSYAIINVIFGGTASLAMICAILTASGFGFLVGWITSRTRDIFFIMTTLAFGQMVYVMIFDAKSLGGDDGMWGLVRLDLSIIGIDMNDGFQFAVFCLICLILVYVIAAHILSSAFGRTFCGIRSNEDRMQALGINTSSYKAIAFALSGGLAGLAGVIAAQHTKFVSPELLVWTVSGEALVVVILGGLGTLVGPVVGATMLVFLKHGMSGYTVYWHLFIGVILIIAVMTGGRGIYGEIENYLTQRRAKHLSKVKANAGN